MAGKPYRVAVLDDYEKAAERLADWSSLGPDARVEFFHDHAHGEDATVERLRDFDVVTIMRERTPFTRSLIARLPRLRLLATTGVHNHEVDLEAAREHGVMVCATGRGEGALELTWALILGLARHIPQEDRALREGRPQSTVGMGFRGKTLGLLGLGRLGQGSARVGAAFNMDLIAWSPNLTAERAAASGAKRVEKKELFERSDIVTVHLGLGETTRGIVGTAEFARMKPSALLINTSRAALVDPGALLEALHSKRIAGAGLDVFEREPLPPDDPLLGAPNTLLSPHLGYVTDVSYNMFFPDLVEDIRAWAAGAPVRVLT